jgi:hypothetical protein
MAMRSFLQGKEFSACSEANVQDDVWSWANFAIWRKKRRNNVGDSGVGDAEGLVMDVDVNRGWTAGGGRDEGGECGSNLPGGVLRVFVEERLKPN